MHAPHLPDPQDKVDLLQARLAERERELSLTREEVHRQHQLLLHLADLVCLLGGMRTEDAQERHLHRFREAVLHSAAGGICVGHPQSDSPCLAFTIWNDAMIRITGYTMEEINADTAAQLLHPDRESRTRAQARIRRVLDGDHLRSEEWPIRRKDGSLRTIAISTSQILATPHGVAIIALIHDVTERRRLETHLARMQKFDSLGALAGGIAHDFNNLLTAILGYADLARKEVGAGSLAGRYLDESMAAARRAAQLTAQILAYTGKAYLATQPLDLSALVNDSVSLLRGIIPAHIKLILDCTANLPFIDADPTQVRQVLLNLVTNAVEALGDTEGEVCVHTACRTLGPTDLETPYAADLVPGEFVLLEVSDTGCGMDGPTLEKIFDPFFTTKFTGRGLGLAAVQGIIRGHHGLIRVRSSPGAGTTFQVYFPMSKHLASIPLPSPTHAPARKPTALVIEDEDSIRHMARALLEHLGHEIVTAADGQAGLDAFDRLGGAVDVVVMDLTMPGLSGMETLAALRQRRADLPVVLMSGYSIGSLAARIDDPHVCLMQKPFSAQALTEALARVRKGAAPS